LIGGRASTGTAIADTTARIAVVRLTSTNQVAVFFLIMTSFLGRAKWTAVRLSSHGGGGDGRCLLDLFAPLSLPQRWPFCWWVAVVVDHFARRAMETVHVKKEPTTREITSFLERGGRHQVIVKL
jgi:hypothetical protein